MGKDESQERHNYWCSECPSFPALHAANVVCDGFCQWVLTLRHLNTLERKLLLAFFFPCIHNLRF